MGRKPERKKLGRGLSALIGDMAETQVTAPGQETPGETGAGEDRPVTSLPIDLINPNPDQPRKDFDQLELAELAASIKERGVIQPVIVRPDPRNDGQYQIVAGERRWRAAQRAQLHALPVVIRELDDKDVLELALIENIQRSDLNPVEEALAYSQLIQKFSYTQDELAKILGKSRPHLANTLRLLSLPAEIQTVLRQGRISAGHARAVINAPDPMRLVAEILAKGLTVRQTEELVRGNPQGVSKKPAARAVEKDADTRQLEGDLSAAIGMRVQIEHRGDGAGELRIRYKSLDELDRVCQQIAG